jgi:hypothetical protein
MWSEPIRANPKELVAGITIMDLSIPGEKVLYAGNQYNSRTGAEERVFLGRSIINGARRVITHHVIPISIDGGYDIDNDEETYIERDEFAFEPLDRLLTRAGR